MHPTQAAVGFYQGSGLGSGPGSGLGQGSALGAATTTVNGSSSGLGSHHAWHHGLHGGSDLGSGLGSGLGSDLDAGSDSDADSDIDGSSAGAPYTSHPDPRSRRPTATHVQIWRSFVSNLFVWAEARVPHKLVRDYKRLVHGAKAIIEVEVGAGESGKPQPTHSKSKATTDLGGGEGGKRASAVAAVAKTVGVDKAMGRPKDHGYRMGEYM